MAVLADGSFYASVSFWVNGAAIVSAILAGVAIVVTVRLANPKRRLLYGMSVVTPLLNAEPDARHGMHGIEVRRGDLVLTDPHVLTVTLVNDGRRDIASSAFDQQRPLILDVGAPILEILKPTPEGDLPVVSKGTMLQIGPALIARRQKISLSLLVNGAAPRLTCPQRHPLIDIDVREGDPQTSAPWRFWVGVVVSMVATLAAVALAAASPPVQTSSAAAPPPASLVGAVVAAVVATLAAMVAVAGRWWDDPSGPGK